MPKDSQLEESKPGYLHCLSKASLKPTVTWYRNGVSISEVRRQGKSPLLPGASAGLHPPLLLLFVTLIPPLASLALPLAPSPSHWGAGARLAVPCAFGVVTGQFSGGVSAGLPLSGKQGCHQPCAGTLPVALLQLQGW